MSLGSVPRLRLSVSTQGSTFTISCAGVLASDTAPALQAEVERALARKARCLRVDVRGLEGADGSGGALIRAVRERCAQDRVEVEVIADADALTRLGPAFSPARPG